MTSFPPVNHLAGDPARGLILLGDHASNALPADYGDLGLPVGQLDRHIGYDIGVAAMVRHMAGLSGATALMSTFSRLLIDPNRGEDDPTLIMRLSDGAIVPGNATVDAEERQRRIVRFHRPYHLAIDAAIEASLTAGIVPVLVSLHSFTPHWKGRARPWQLAVLWDSDDRLVRPAIEAFRAEGWTVGDNEPYDGALRNDTLHRHATARGLAHVLIEVRQDLIAHEEDAAIWAERLWRVLAPLVDQPQMRQIAFRGSRTGAISRV